MTSRAALLLTAVLLVSSACTDERNGARPATPASHALAETARSNHQRELDEATEALLRGFKSLNEAERAGLAARTQELTELLPGADPERFTEVTGPMPGVRVIYSAPANAQWYANGWFPTIPDSLTVRRRFAPRDGKAGESCAGGSCALELVLIPRPFPIFVLPTEKLRSNGLKIVAETPRLLAWAGDTLHGPAATFVFGDRTTEPELATADKESAPDRPAPIRGLFLTITGPGEEVARVSSSINREAFLALIGQPVAKIAAAPAVP